MKKKHNISLRQALKNNVYALKLLASSSRSRTAHTFIASVLMYFDSIFYSAIFMRFVLNAIEGEKGFGYIVTFILATSALFMAITIYRIYVDNVSNPVTDIKVYRHLYANIYRKAENVDLNCYENAEFYNKYTMAIDRADKKVIDTASNFAKVITSFFAFVWAAYIMFSIDSFLVFFIIFPVIGNFIFGNMINKIYYNRYRDGVYFDRKAEYVNRVMYLPDFAKEIRLSNVFNILRRDYDDAVKGTAKVIDKYSKRGTVLAFLQTYFTFTLIFEGVLLYSCYRAVVGHSMPLSDLAVLTSLMTNVSWLLMGFTESLMKLFENGLFVQNLRTFLEHEEEYKPSESSVEIPQKINSIEFKNVSFWYDDKNIVLDNVSFKMQGGSRAALVGINGAGKSTLVKLLLRLYKPCKGEILLNEVNIQSYDLIEYRRLFSCAFQDFKLYSDSVYQNISMGRNISQNDVENAVKKSGAFYDIESLENKFDEILTKEFDEKGAVLSGGQQQKIAVARAFVGTPLVRVFDEPSSALDPIAEYNLFSSILKETRGSTTFFISHRLSSVKSADVVFMLSDGKIIEQGTHEELIAFGGKYAEMFNAQARNYLADDEFDEAKNLGRKEVQYAE